MKEFQYIRFNHCVSQLRDENELLTDFILLPIYLVYSADYPINRHTGIDIIKKLLIDGSVIKSDCQVFDLFDNELPTIADKKTGNIIGYFEFSDSTEFYYSVLTEKARLTTIFIKEEI